MKFTAQEEYGLRCILQLARIDRKGKEPGEGSDPEPPAEQPSLSVSEVARTEGLSEQYVGKLFRILAKDGLIASVRGRRGGYRLSRPPDEIHVAETLAALGGRIYEPQVCERYRGNRLFCVHTNDCAVRSLWAGLQLMIEQVLGSTTLEDLVCSERTMAEWMQARSDACESLEALKAPPVDFVEYVGVPAATGSVAEEKEKDRNARG